MTDDSLPLVPSEKNSSSWNFDYLHNENELENSNDFFSVLKTNITKNVYLNHEEEEKRNNETKFSNKITEYSTIHIDTSDLISRCKNFLPLLTNANENLFSKIKSGENVRIELDSDDDDNNNERTIEMNLMFCPNTDSSSSSSSESEDEQIQIQVNKKSNSINIIEIDSSNKLEEN